MSEQKRQFPTPEMLKAREEWAKKTPQEKEAFENRIKEKKRKYYDGHPSFKMTMALRGEDPTEEK